MAYINGCLTVLNDNEYSELLSYFNNPSTDEIERRERFFNEVDSLEIKENEDGSYEVSLDFTPQSGYSQTGKMEISMQRDIFPQWSTPQNFEVSFKVKSSADKERNSLQAA